MSIIFFQNRKRSGVPQGGITALYDFKAGSGQTLADQSGAGRNSTLGSTSGTDTTDPAWSSSGLVFDGVDDFVTVPSIALGPEHTIIVVATLTAVPAVSVLMGTSDAGSYMAILNGSLASFNSLVDSVSQKSFSFGAISLSAAFMMTRRVSQAGQYFDAHLNSSKSSQTATVGAHNSNVNIVSFLGKAVGGAPMTGTIHYVALYSRLLSDAEVQTAYKNLKQTLIARGVSLP